LRAGCSIERENEKDRTAARRVVASFANRATVLVESREQNTGRAVLGCRVTARPHDKSVEFRAT